MEVEDCSWVLPRVGNVCTMKRSIQGRKEKKRKDTFYVHNPALFLIYFSLPGITHRRRSCARCRHGISMIRIRLPGHGPGRRNVDIFILYDRAGRQVQRHEPEGISACVFGSGESDCAVGIPVSQCSDRAGNLYCLAVGRADDLVEGDGDGGGGCTGR
jgi:hypothetical protein